MIKTQAGKMALNFQMKNFTGTEHFQNQLKVLDRVSECYTGKNQLVYNLTSAKHAISLLKCHDALAFDCEGVELGRGGKITLVQIGAKGGMVYLFDVLELGKDLFSVGLKDILESQNIYKYMYDCRFDSDSLYHEFNVKLTNVLDMQIFEFIARPIAVRPLRDATKPEHYNAPRVRGLGGAIKDYIKPSQIRKIGLKDLNQLKNAGKDVMDMEKTFWSYRPLSEGMKRYAALDVEMIWLISDILQSYYSLTGITMERLKVASDVYTNMRRGADRRLSRIYVRHPLLLSFVIPEINSRNELIPFQPVDSQCYGCRRFFIRSFVTHSLCEDCQEIRRVYKCRVKKKLKRY